jgi:hypothetical protein|nr:MAG TPA: hypothetical protein [Caudoviricetes sp.]
MKKYIFVAKNLDLPEFFFAKGTIYYGEKIEKLIAKYPLLAKVLVDVEQYPKIEASSEYFDSIIDEIRGGKNVI